MSKTETRLGLAAAFVGLLVLFRGGKKSPVKVASAYAKRLAREGGATPAEVASIKWEKTVALDEYDGGVGSFDVHFVNGDAESLIVQVVGGKAVGVR